MELLIAVVMERVYLKYNVDSAIGNPQYNLLLWTNLFV